MTADRGNERGGSSAATAEVGAAASGAGIADDPAVDEAVIEQLATITDSEGFSVLGELLNAFLTATPVRLDALDHALASRDLAVVGIRINTIAPGLIDTPIYGQGEASEAFKDKLKKDVVFPDRLGRAEEFASLALELITNSYMNGETRRIDGAARLQPK